MILTNVSLKENKLKPPQTQVLLLKLNSNVYRLRTVHTHFVWLTMLSVLISAASRQRAREAIDVQHFFNFYLFTTAILLPALKHTKARFNGAIFN